ncbi:MULTISPECIES: hypothetical protein [unclassified Rhodococcus (in: high G+C Gram-positive bacteria)]|uniref:hypothetical protein n=1 Tax=unclassified Rhodococcus (in: high G+C Gram-positive bacteria) TaxID=192944 RepID=UPI0011ECE93A|nr:MULTISPECIES: hypothetical protein [unclassified Rhodococcus (in: high G+C Gram-positive bacteria)]KAA0924507.1 hypothetical protein FQ188_14725 [Rhodococcus sp. ANT_H53B]MDI9926033.1 hypothetical protein [Rhodococcus sp. IEGM 1341]
MPAQAWITLIVGLIAVVGVVGTVSQRTRADNRSQSWQRITWCLERTVSENDDEAALGWKVFGTVATTPFIARSDRDTLQAIADLTVKPQDDLAEPAETGDNENDTETEDPR